MAKPRLSRFAGFALALVLAVLSVLALGVAWKGRSRPPWLVVAKVACAPGADVASDADVLCARLGALGMTEISSSIDGQVVSLAFRPALRASPDELFPSALVARGHLEFLVAASDATLAGRNTSLTVETERFESWRRAHPGAPLADFNTLARDAGGPCEGLLWMAHDERPRASTDPIPPERAAADSPPPIALVRPPAEWRFASSDLQRVRSVEGEHGSAVEFELADSRKQAFADFTGSIVEEGLAITVDDRIVTLAHVRERLPGQLLVERGRGGFTNDEAQQLVATLRSGELSANATLSPPKLSPSRNARWIPWLAAGVLAALASIGALVVGLISGRRALARSSEAKGAWSSAS